MKRLICISVLTVLIGGTIFAPAKAESQEERSKKSSYLNEIWEKVRENCPTGPNFRECKADQGPKKCAVLVYSQDISAWSQCVRSCGTAGVVSRTIGECS